jgi:alpha-1,2-mannosyltransferase
MWRPSRPPIGKADGLMASTAIESESESAAPAGPAPRWGPWAVVGGVVTLVCSITLFLVVRPLGHGVFEYPDLNVYRDAGRRLLDGHPLYTTDPKVLPFTYPPFAAVVSTVFALVPRKVAGFAWFLANIAMLAVTVRIVFRPALDRLPRAAVIASLLVLTAAMFWVRPVNDTVDWGQINLLLLLLVLVDGMGVTRVPRGLLVGVAAAIKLVPGIFVVYFGVTRQWKAAATALASLGACILLAQVIAPSSSTQYWTRTLFESNRIGNSRYYSNQSLLGMVQRLVPGAWVPYVWATLALVIVGLGLRRVRQSYDAGDVLAALTITGLLGCLCSPISWFHHFVWMLPALGVLVDDGRDRRRVIMAAALAVAVTTSLPYVGIHLIDAGGAVGAVGWLLENSLGLLTVLLVVALPYRDLRSRRAVTAPVDREPVAVV